MVTLNDSMSYLAYITVCSVVVALLQRFYFVDSQLTFMLTNEQSFKNSAISAPFAPETQAAHYHRCSACANLCACADISYDYIKTVNKTKDSMDVRQY